ncbi:hypothetical protein FHA39_08520 [Escherichia coli]|nr:hypothetical protein [Escherichia coli]
MASVSISCPSCSATDGVVRPALRHQSSVLQ